MAPEEIFDFNEMMSLVGQYFRDKGYEVKENSTYREMKVHVCACKKGKRETEVIAEVIAEVSISKEISPLLIGENLGKDLPEVDEKVGVLTYFQIYFHPTKIYLAVPYYATNLDEIKKLCEWEGIGLLQVTWDKKIMPLLESSDRVKLFKEVVNEQIGGTLDIGKREEIINTVGMLADHLLIHRAVITLATSPPSYQMNINRNLLEKMKTLSKEVIYREDINDFCKSYLTQRVDDYNIVLKWVKDLWKKYIKIPEITSSFDFYGDFENILKLDKEYRDHFLHQFQVFLLGTLILDGIYNKFQEYYKKPFENLSEKSVFKSWLMVSTFHDFAYPLERYAKWNDELFKRLLNINNSLTVIGFEKIITERKFIEYLDQMDNLLNCYKTDGDNWCCGKPHTINENLRRFLLDKIVFERNHGVLSSLALLKKSESEKISKETLSTEIYPAALAIAIHDQGIWQPLRGKQPSWRKETCEWEEEFLKCNYLKHLDFSKQPLSFLLIFCDTAQEFGRPNFPYSDNESGQKPQFEDMIVNKDKIQVIVSVPDSKAFSRKQTELQAVTDFLKCSGIHFIFTLHNKEDNISKDFPVTN